MVYFPERINVMISSRCKASIKFGGSEKRLSDLRKEIKDNLQSEKLLGGELIHCWINEDHPSAGGTQDIWDESLKHVRRADVLLVLYNGHAGWTHPGHSIGICHAELEAGLSSGSDKVRGIRLPMTQDGDPAQHDRNLRFQEFVESQSPFWLQANDGDEAVRMAREALHKAVIEMVKLGAQLARKGKYDTGDALKWSRLDFFERRQEMQAVLLDCLAGRNGAEPVPDNVGAVVVNLSGTQILLACHAVPAAMSVAAAREMVGRPFLKDHELKPHLQNAVGPVHLIACHRNVTEKQATDLLGFPDATVVRTNFGVFVADKVQNVQLLLLAECRDDTTTRQAVQRAIDWLARSGEERNLAVRAKSRRNIVRAIAKEVAAPVGNPPDIRFAA